MDALLFSGKSDIASISKIYYITNKKALSYMEGIMSKLEGKVAIITGGANGMGRRMPVYLYLKEQKLSLRISIVKRVKP